MAAKPIRPASNVNNTRAVRGGEISLSDGTIINIADILYDWDEDGKVRTLEQDNTAPPLIWWVNQVIAETYITVAANIDDNSITVNDTTGIVIGQKYSLLNVAADRVSLGEIINIIGNVVYLDSLMDYAYPINSPFAARTHNLAVDGSITPQKFIMRGVDEDIPGRVDITRIIISCYCDSAVSFNKFGDLAELTKGLLFRIENGITWNIFNIKTNQELAALTFDFDIYEATNPSQGQDGFVARLTFNGQSKMGVVLRIGPDDEVAVYIQDDLTGLQGLYITLEGHFVTD